MLNIIYVWRFKFKYNRSCYIEHMVGIKMLHRISTKMFLSFTIKNFKEIREKNLKYVAGETI